ncbi:MAG: hypothetical protein A3H98_02705 [Bacteroidetes bacterium RIFCSPLOWO2_02_FULL_36_8]|nr:MAG: hypothetical protein A3H98_02705 [Bacteroidetes bacterium RIFCSPLOWO2_02_FULL_36_8]OFY69885.1 MAG: hypothetical protein A3G23_05330 [Bacteroidetes bacterium RIFCSPLOWO2_12_FULL_37_12]
MIIRVLYLFVLLFCISCAGTQTQTSSNSTGKKNTGGSYGYNEDITGLRQKYPDAKNSSKSVAVYKAPPLNTQYDDSKEVDSLIQVRPNNEEQVTQGYRVLVFSGSDRTEAMEKRKLASKIIPDVTTYLFYNQPYFKVKIGDFLTRIEAQQIYNLAKKDFPEALIISDKINVRGN